jgi:hypothetical protein
MQPTRDTRDPTSVRLYVSRAVTHQAAPFAFGRTTRGADSCVIW